MVIKESMLTPFIKNYLDILESYAGLSEEQMSREKLKLYHTGALKWELSNALKSKTSMVPLCQML